MMTNGVQPPKPPGELKDRKTGLVLFGALAIVVGSFLGLLALLTPAAMLVGGEAGAGPGQAPELPAIDARAAVLGTVLYAALAALFVWVGVGSIRIRRWVRPIALILGWTWLLTGLVGLVFWLMMLPNIRSMVESAQPSEPPLDPGAYTAISLIASAFIALAYVILPAAFVWFYQDRSVRATLERHDPIPRWTDRCPLPVLGLSIGLWAGAALCLTGFAYNVVPLFGVVLTGPAAAATLILLAGACAWLGLATYRLRLAGWWGTLALTVALMAGQIITLLRVDMVDISRSLGLPEEQLAIMREYGGTATTGTLLASAVVGVACIGYMVYVRRWFPGPPPPMR